MIRKCLKELVNLSIHEYEPDKPRRILPTTDQSVKKKIN